MKKYIFIHRVKIICLLTLWVVSFNSMAQKKNTRILFLLDASSSMTYEWNKDYKRFDIASIILLQIIDSVYSKNNEVEFAVRTYGSEHLAQEKNCTDTRLEVPFNYQNVSQIKTRLKYIQALGSSPIAYSLKQATENELSEEYKYDYTVIFITDGGESCNGDVCKTYQEVLAKKIKIKPYVIGLDKNDNLKTYYDCLGQYIEIASTDDIPKAVSMIVEANKLIINKPQSLNLKTTYSNTIIKKDTTVQQLVKKDTLVKKTIDKIGELSSSNYQPKNKNISLKVGKPRVINKNKVTVSFNIEEDKKDNLSLNYLTSKSYAARATKKEMKLRKYIQYKKEKVTIAFTEDKPEEVVNKITSVFPKLVSKNYVPALYATKTTIAKAKTLPKAKVTISFAVEEPLVREAIVFKYLMGKNYIHPLTLKKEIKKRNPIAYNKKPITIAFTTEREAPVNVINPLVRAEYRQRYSYVYKMPNYNKLPIRKQSLTVAFKIDGFTATNTKPKPAPTPTINSSVLEYTTEKVDYTETLIQIFFVDRNTNNKKYTKAKPEIEILNPTTKASVLKFERKVENGEPIPQKIIAGTYNIIVKGQDDLTAKNVVIEANKINKIFIKVSEGKLQFSYMGNRERPVEYNAIVNRRFAKGMTVLQKCTDKLYYEPGNYYIEINTLPPIKYNTDIYFDAVTEYQLFEPGHALFLNENNLGKVQLQVMLGDEFLTFYEINITGNIENQRLELQPNTYQAVFYKDPNVPALGKKTIRFNIQSNQLTNVTLE